MPQLPSTSTARYSFQYTDTARPVITALPTTNGLPTPTSKLDNDPRSLSGSPKVDPDQLFVKHTVSEVKTVQKKLISDADAKQEELRLMVGERYRDLLQASTSIISIAKSSRRVLQALEEVQESIVSQEEPPLPRQSSKVSTMSDKNLHTLQIISAHIKVLLDAPEHLWRYIEHKQYLQAAWLFLLARVIYRAFVRDDEQDGNPWSDQGVDIMNEFPLVQRQWELVGQFRSQIIQKANSSLRESSTTPEEICGTLVTLHLLDSKPLGDAGVALLSQRSKTLQSALSWNPSLSHHTNGKLLNEKINTNHSVSANTLPKEVKEAISNGLNIITQTVCTTRTIFEGDDCRTSLMGRVLKSMQSDQAITTGDDIPDELNVKTQTLLMKLTSSAHVLLLSPDLRTYRPYIDLESLSSSVQDHLFRKLNEWFETSANLLRTSAVEWLSHLQSVKDVWNTRTSIRSWVTTTKLQHHEQVCIQGLLDDLCKDRVVGIWRLSLSHACDSFKDRLQQSISSDHTPEKQLPVNLLFDPPILPSLMQITSNSTNIPFQKYQATLKKQLAGRDSALDDVLLVLEECVRDIQRDVAHLLRNEDKAKNKIIIDQLSDAYLPAAEAMAEDIVETLETFVSQTIEESEIAIHKLVLLGRVVDTLASDYHFMLNLGCQKIATQEFRSKLKSLHERIVDSWRNSIIIKITRCKECLPFVPSSPKLKLEMTGTIPTDPSPELVDALVTLSGAIQEFTLHWDRTQSIDIIGDALHMFAVSWSQKYRDHGETQISFDLMLLKKILALYNPGWADDFNKEDTVPARTALNSKELDSATLEYLARTQTLFSVFLPFATRHSNNQKATCLLPLGIPSSTETFKSALNLTNPGPRFSLLLVGGTTEVS